MTKNTNKSTIERIIEIDENGDTTMNKTKEKLLTTEKEKKEESIMKEIVEEKS